ncbi:MAG: lysin [Podoviridae sp. ctg2L5]|nr:MAG: lysin [Podoviridae sp. ctg2L5]
MLKGADISKYQGDVNFDQFKDAVDFVIIRSSYGVGYKDTKYVRNRDEARHVNLLRGFYHYAYPQHNTPEKEADWFLRVIGKPQEGELLALDFEEEYADPVNWSLKFLNFVSTKLDGYKPLIYINMNFNNRWNWHPVVNANYGLWLARWDFNPDTKPPQTDWPVVAMRQYTNQQNFAGIAGRVDGNVFYGETNDYLKYGFKGEEVSEPPSGDMEITNSTKIPASLLTGEAFKPENDMEVQAIRSTLNDQKRDLIAANQRIEELEGQVGEQQFSKPKAKHFYEIAKLEEQG